ncbi:MAG: phosphatidylinositol alpha 1,6-mannosyltransferase [Actinomycetota bacterium]|nr:phosphatidylinositol alpha 1,6-mannosyltransferase [Actinomycetota bacterium]
MRLAIVTESFLPQVNGVTNSVLRVCEHVRAAGSEVLVVAPGAGPTRWEGIDVVRVPSVPVPGYPSHRMAWPWPPLAQTLRAFAPDLIHLASPTLLGAQALSVAERSGVPCLAVYQTDLPAYAGRYHVPAAAGPLWKWLHHIHSRADLTLAPSTHSVAELERHRIPRVRLWPRGVDLDRFHPLRRDPLLRSQLRRTDELLVGYVGRLAAEKQIELLATVADLPKVRLVVVGDGPQKGALERLLPRALFLGQITGARLASVYASLDVFVHTGPHETFCQTVQEALASGLPVVAPAAGGIPDLVRDGRNGLLFEAGSGRQLREAVSRLVDSPRLRGVLAETARESVSGRSQKAIGDAYLEYCRQVLPNGHRTGSNGGTRSNRAHRFLPNRRWDTPRSA